MTVRIPLAAAQATPQSIGPARYSGAAHRVSCCLSAGCPYMALRSMSDGRARSPFACRQRATMRLSFAAEIGALNPSQSATLRSRTCPLTDIEGRNHARARPHELHRRSSSRIHAAGLPPARVHPASHSSAPKQEAACCRSTRPQLHLGSCMPEFRSE